MKPLNLLPHEADAAARGELSMIWRPVRNFPDWMNIGRIGSEPIIPELTQTMVKIWTDYCPLGPPGTLLWGKEATEMYYLPHILTGEPTTHKAGRYCADGEPVLNDHGFDYCWWYSKPTCPATRMPREFSRTTLRVLSVVVKRVGEVTEEEARAWGVSGRGTSSQPYLEAFYVVWNAKWGKKLAEPGLAWAWGVQVRSVEPSGGPR